MDPYTPRRVVLSKHRASNTNACAPFFDFSFSNCWIFRKTTNRRRPINFSQLCATSGATGVALFKTNFLFCRPVSSRINQALECKAVSRKAGEFLSGTIDFVPFFLPNHVMSLLHEIEELGLTMMSFWVLSWQVYFKPVLDLFFLLFIIN